MEIDRIDKSVFSPYSSIINDFISGSENLSDMISESFGIEGFKKQIIKRDQTSINRDLLVNSLTQQYRRSGIDLKDGSLTISQIESLKDSNCFTVTTGHQLCIFTGPLYFIIKIIQIIKIADWLNEALEGKKVIPVFWMATEDHDFEEINHTYLFGKKILWEGTQGGAVGAYDLVSFNETLTQMNELLGDGDHAKRLREIFTGAYSNSKNLADATRKMVHELFADRGLVIIDGDDESLKETFIPQMSKEIADQVVFENTSAPIEEMNAKGYKIQVNPRPLNLFYLEKGNRYRLDIEGEKIVAVEGSRTWKKEELIKELGKFPERFSPNVLMRPVYQEVILPNLCYVGGPGEIAYWLELKNTFTKFELPFPILNLRNSILWLDSNKLKKMRKLGLVVQDFFANESEITLKLTNSEDDEERFNSELSSVIEAFERISNLAANTDESLRPFVIAEGKKIEKQLDHIKTKIIRAKKKKNEDALNGYWNLHEKLFPGNALHERYDNFVPYFLKHGPTFFEQVYEAIQPMDSRLCVISED